MSVTRSCVTCAYFEPGSKLEDAHSRCWPCAQSNMGRLPNWMPKAVIPIVPVKTEAPLSTQVGGSHYTSMAIQPLEYAQANNLDFFQKDILKYITRIKGDKAKRLEDLRKAQHYLDLYITAIESDEWPALGFVKAV